MKTISRYIMTLLLLITAATGAWATEPRVINSEISHESLKVGDILVEGFSISGPYSTMFYFNAGRAKKGETLLTEDVKFYKGDITSVGTNAVITLYDGAYFDAAGTYTPIDENGQVANAWIVTSMNESGNSDFHLSGYKYVAPTDEPTVTLNDDKTEASFLMPTSDATVDYELVRDMSVQMQAQVGDDPDKQPRYRVKKEDNVFKPADLSPAQVMALFSVNDQIEQKVLTPTTDYIVNIYAIDEEGQPTGNPMTFADFTFEPGIYAVKAVAAEGSPYDGESALSNTFVLFQGYEVYVPAGEFATYYKDEALYVEDEDAKLYTITTVGNETATATELTLAAANTPLLVKNNAAEAKTILLIPTTATPDDVTPYEGFKGTLEATQIAASTANQNNYALNGKEFVWVMDAIDIAANRAWLEIPATTTNSRALTIVFDDVTGMSNNLTPALSQGEGAWYDLNGRKLQAAPTKKGVYILNGKKVVVK